MPRKLQIFFTPCKQVGKRVSQSLSVATAGSPHLNTLSAHDINTGTLFLIDTGADISVFPASKLERQTRVPTQSLTAANGSTIRAWGTKSISLTLRSGKTYSHDFQLADVKRPILGADFFIAHGFLIDLKGKRLLSRDQMSIALQNSNTSLSLSGLTFPSQDRYSSILQEFRDILTPTFDSDVNKHGIEHHIITTGPPTHARARRLDTEKLAAVKKEFLQMEQMGIIRRSKSAWASPLHVVPKANGQWRPCGDYRQLNAMTQDDRYPLPHIQDLNSRLDGCRIFSKIDLVRGYHQIPMASSSVAKTAIITPFGLWEFLRMPFGLKNAGQAFQRLMDGILRDVPFAFVYLDDILIASQTPAEHELHLRQVFQLLSSNGLVINKAKCTFGVKDIDFLGHRVSAKGIQPLPDRITALRECKAPKDRTGLQRFLGMINYYHRFLPHVAAILTPLHAQATGKGQHLDWSEDCELAFQKAKDALSNATLLHHPRSNAPTSLTVDASNTAIGGQIEQLHSGSWVPIAFFSRKLSVSEKKYSAFDRELLAAYNAIKHFRYLLEGRPFTLYTDHKPLTSAIASNADRSPRQTRQLSYIAEFTTDIQHIKGKFNVVADAMSRVNAITNTAVDSLHDASTCAELCSLLGDFEQLAKDQQESEEMSSYQASATGLKLENIRFGSTTLLCDVSTGTPRPILPSNWTRPVFDNIHGLSHAGPRPTQQAISQRFVWHGMKKDVRKWCRECHPCQSSKFHRHTQAPLTERELSKARFSSIHVDIVGPIPVCQGMSYLFTIIDRFTRWPEVVPLPDIQAATCASALLNAWISRFGVPEEITSDRGAQFTSTLWNECNKLLGIKCHNTTSYHPQANGMVERLHRQLKASLKARTTSPHWLRDLPLVMLGIRSSWRVDPDCSPAELVYGTTLRLPGEFLQPTDLRTMQPTTTFVKNLQNTMRSLNAPPTHYHGQQKSYVSASLPSADYVYVRHDARRHPLQRPYDGPFKVIERHDKYFTLNVNGKVEKISIDRLKPAHTTLFLNNNVNDNINAHIHNDAPAQQNPC